MSEMSSKKSIVFRADAGRDIGTGHVMRCLTLANAAKERGAECHFLCVDTPGHLGARIRADGHGLSLLRPPERPEPSESPDLAHARWLTGSQAQDSQASADAMPKEKVDWLVLDHYALDHHWQTLMRSKAHRCLTIDDLADRRFQTDILVDPNPARLGQSAYADLVDGHVKQLLGGRYAILRPEFRAKREKSLVRRQVAASGKRSLLITFGGVDAPNATRTVLDALAGWPALGEHLFRIDVVLGAHAPHKRSVENAAASLSVPTRIHMDVRDMAGLLYETDIVIGAPGSSAWERCCMGVPSILFKLAGNQAEICRYLAAAGAAVEISEISAATLGQAILDLTPDRLVRMGLAAAKLVDGAGTERILDLMMSETAI